MASGRLPGQGRPGAPTKLKVLRGEKKARRLNFNEPKQIEGVPELPDGLSRAAVDVWNEQIRDVERMGVIAPTDRWMFAAYCESVARFREATSVLAQTGLVMKTADGKSIMRNPMFAAQRDAITLMVRLAAEFGLSPRARSEITAGNQDRDDRETLLS